MSLRSVALVAIPTAALVALVGWRAALPPVAASEAPELPAEEIAWFVQTGCTTCHTVSVYNLNTIAPRAPDLSTAVVDVRHRFGRSLEDAPTVLTDGDRLLQVVTNLLANAFQWTPDGGAVTLELARSAGAVTVAVADTGPGIDPAERERIFRPFWSRNGQGTGLGLPIARELTHALGGRIELESEPGAGSRFTVVLPAERTARTPVAAGA